MGKNLVSLSGITLFAFTLALAGCEKKETVVTSAAAAAGSSGTSASRARGSAWSSRCAWSAWGSRCAGCTGSGCANGEERRRENQVRNFSLTLVDATEKGEGFNTFPFFAISVLNSDGGDPN